MKIARTLAGYVFNGRFTRHCVLRHHATLVKSSLDYIVGVVT